MTMIGVAAPSILDVADKELVLRVRGPSRQGQIVRLKSKRLTIGSGARCTLRLRARGVRPLHCLVLRGDAGAVIRRFAPDTRLNGRAFTDAELVPGDQLSVGPVEFEVLASGASTQVRLDQPQEKASEPQEEEWNRRRIELDDLAAKLRQSEEDLDERERSASQRAADLHQRADQIDRARADLEAERRGFEEQRRAWDADRAASESQAGGEREQLEARLAELTVRHDALEQDIQRYQSEKAEIERQFSERTSELEARYAALDARQNELDARRAKLDARRADLDARESELDQLRRQMEIDDRPAEADTRPEPEPEEPDREPDARFDEPIQGSLEGSEEIPSRMGLAPSIHEDEADGPSPNPAEPIERDRCESVSPPPESGEGQGESIDDYMARLLDRVRERTGQPNPPIPPRFPEETAIAEPPPTAPVEEWEDSAHGAPSPPAAAREATEQSPRATAPEKLVDMAAMRELANFSARTAINRHARRTHFGSVAGRLVVALVGLVAGTILTWFWWTDPANNTVLCAAAVSFVVVLLWGVEYTVLRSYAVLRQPGPGEWNDKAEQHAAGAPQPEQEIGELP